jgi:hypothetical protein
MPNIVPHADLGELYETMAAEHLMPLWTQVGELMPDVPTPQAVAHLWRWKTLFGLAEQAGALVPIGRGGERRGYTIMNDVTLRDWQFRTREWLQGKTFEATAPFGPHLVTPDELAADAAISCILDDEVVQESELSPWL